MGIQPCEPLGTHINSEHLIHESIRQTVAVTKVQTFGLAPPGIHSSLEHDCIRALDGVSAIMQRSHKRNADRPDFLKKEVNCGRTPLRRGRGFDYHSLAYRVFASGASQLSPRDRAVHATFLINRFPISDQTDKTRHTGFEILLRLLNVGVIGRGTGKTIDAGRRKRMRISDICHD